MKITIDSGRFHAAHELFLQHMKDEANGEPFEDFDHRPLREKEIDYKWNIRETATGILSLQEWDQWRKTPGRILEVVKEICRNRVNKNLLEHRFGERYILTFANSLKNIYKL